jgi:hypothetical protein
MSGLFAAQRTTAVAKRASLRGILLAAIAVLIGTSVLTPAAVRGAAGFEIAHTIAWVDSGGFFHITGDVTNVMSIRQQFVEIDATYYNASGEVIGTGVTYAELTTLAPGGTSPFEIMESEAPAGYDHFALIASSSPTSERAVGALVPAVGVAFTDGLGFRHIPGEVTNESNETLDFPEIIVALYSANGTVINTQVDYAGDSLAPGATAPFEIIFTDRYDYARYSIQTYADGASGFATSWDNYFDDIGFNGFRVDIIWLAASAITTGCADGLYCPDDSVTRGQMAAFLARALDLPNATKDYFTDDETSIFEADINRLAEAGITTGCTSATTYCPTQTVTRGQMAAYLDRALKLPATSTDYFTDDETSIFEVDINRLAASGITSGCTATTYCPAQNVTRGQMAAFLHRAFG